MNIPYSLTVSASLWLLTCCLSTAITWRPSMTDPAPNTNRNVSAISLGIGAEPRFNGTGIVSVNTSQGTGALIAPGWVLTARHVIVGATSGTFFYSGGSSSIASFHVMPDSDVALIRLTTPVNKSSVSLTPIYQGNDELGKDVWLIGHGMHGEFTGNPNLLSSAFGRYGAKNKISSLGNVGGTGGRITVFQYDTGTSALAEEGATAPGDSGGPMFMEQDGRLWVVGETLGAIANVGFTHGRVSQYKGWIATTTGINFNEATWDANPGTAGIQQGSGTWTTASTTNPWQFQNKNFQWGNGYDVVFQGNGSAATVTLGSPVTAASIVFDSAGYLISSTSHALTLEPDADVTAGQDVTIRASISGTTLTKKGNGTLSLERSNSFSGRLTVNSGRIRISNGGALGAGAGDTLLRGGLNRAGIEFTGGIRSNEAVTMQMQHATDHFQLHNISGTNTLSGEISLTTGGIRWDIASSAGSLNISGPVASIVASADTTRTLYLNGSGSGNFSAGISDSAAASKVNLQVDSGSWSLNGSAKSYTGTTTAAGGNLRVDCQLVSPVTVQSGAVFSGKGSTSGALAVSQGAVIFRPLTNWTTPGTAFSAASLADTSASSWTLRLDATGLGNFSETPKTVPILSSVSSLAAIDTGKISLELNGFTGKGNWAVSKTQNALNLVYTPDPYLFWASTIAWNGRDQKPSGDPDFDGLTNLLEFALGSSPVVSSPAASPSLTALSANNYQFRFFRASSGLTYLVRSSPDLMNWTTVATNPGTVGQMVSFSPPPPNPPGKAFYRLEVMEN